MRTDCLIRVYFGKEMYRPVMTWQLEMQLQNLERYYLLHLLGERSAL